MKNLTLLLVLFIAFAFVAPVQASAGMNAGIKPGNFLYFFDTTFENIGLFFTFNPEQKAQKALEYADERLAEMEAVAEEKNPDGVKTALANYESNVALATEKSKEVKDKGQAEILLTSIADSASRNQEVLSAVLLKVPEEAREAITKAIEVSKKGQEEAMKQIVELKSEIEKLKNEVEKLKKGYKGSETDTRANEVEKLKNEVEVLKQKSVVEPAPKQLPPAISLSELELQRQELKAEQLQRDSQVQKLQMQQKEDALAKRQTCLNTHPTQAQIQQAVDAAIATLNSSMATSKSSVVNQYDSQIAQIKIKLQNDLASAQEAQRGYATNSALLKQIQDYANADIVGLESRKQELLSMADATYGTKIADVRMKEIKMMQESSEATCGL